MSMSNHNRCFVKYFKIQNRLNHIDRLKAFSILPLALWPLLIIHPHFCKSWDVEEVVKMIEWSDLRILYFTHNRT